MKSPRPRRNALLGHALALAGVLAVTLVAFLPVLRNDFVNWDDPEVFQRNAHLDGPGALRWAFTTTHMGHYQPLSWLVWSQVKALVGLDAQVFHGISLLGHLLNTALVYLVCLRLAALGGLEVNRGRVAAIVASLAFAVHPIRVEAVAWASAFPYVLSLGALLLGVLAYLSAHTQTPAHMRRGWLALSVGAYAASILARASAVGFPFVLLALDVYPLRRLTLRRRGGARSALGLILEKIPFFAIALAAAAAESRARELATLQEIGAGARVTMAVTAPFSYLARTVAPVRLSPLDPLPIEATVEWIPLVVGIASLIATTVVVWKTRRRWPALVVAWAAYVLLLAPATGLTPSGLQATADRYTYLPGVAVALVIGVAIARSRFARVRTSTLAAILVVLGVATWRQTGWWHDSIALWTRVADLDPRNDIATYNLAIALADADRETEAIGWYEQTLRLVPDHTLARFNLTLLQANRAERDGDRLAAAGRLDEAIEEYARALALDTKRVHARAARGIALMRRGRFAEAAEDLRAAFDARGGTAAQPSTDTGGAVAQPLRAARTADAEVPNALAFTLIQTGRAQEAVAVLKRAIAEHPDDFNLAHNLARLLATSPDPGVRDGELALKLAQESRDRTGGRDPRVLDTLAAAYAATGELNLARQTAEEAAALARQLGDRDLASEIAANAKRYQRR